MTMEKIFFRYVDRASDVDRQTVFLDRYRLVRLSPSGKTAWVESTDFPPGLQRKRFCPGAHRPWAHDTIEEAWIAYRRRKHWQVARLEDSLARARACYLFAKEAEPPAAHLVTLSFDPLRP